MYLDRLIDKNFLQRKLLLPASHQSMQVVVYELGITNIYTTLNSDSFNCVIGGDFSQLQTQRSADHIINFYKNKNQDFTWYMPPSMWSKEGHEVLNKLGLKNVQCMNSMIVSLDDIKVNVQSTKYLEIKTIENDQILEDFSSILELFNSNANQYYQMVKGYIIRNNNLKCYVGYLNKIPICTGSIYINKDIICLYDLITLLPFRRKGFATQMINFMIKNVKKNKQTKFVGLQASNEGIYLYPKLGFQKCGMFYLYSFG